MSQHINEFLYKIAATDNEAKFKAVVFGLSLAFDGTMATYNRITNRIKILKITRRQLQKRKENQ